MNDDQDNASNPLKVAFQEVLSAVAKKQKKEREKPAYKQSKLHLSRISRDFMFAANLVGRYSTRGAEIYKEIVTIRRIDDIMQSAVTIEYLAEEGFFNPARRELRYLLESSLKYLHLDKEFGWKTPLAEKLKQLENLGRRFSIEDCRKHPLDGIPENSNSAFWNEVLQIHDLLCAYVHPSVKQIEEDHKRNELGFYVGMDMAAEVETMANLIFRVYDIVLVILFNGLGGSMTGDLFINVFDDSKAWKFHKGKFCRQVSASFDYKHERKVKAAAQGR